MAMQSDHEFAPSQIASAEFPTAFRGYDPDAVRHYLTRLAAALEEKGDDALAALARTTTLDRIEELEEENDTLRSEVRDLELELVQRSVDGSGNRSSARSGRGDGDDEQFDIEGELDAAFDEHRAIELLGKETARVLESARSAAADIVKRAERQAKTVDKEARGELAEARRKARRLVAEKQNEAEALVAKVASEAEESAERMRSEAEQHREMVMAESKRIMADAESQAAADEKWAQERAEQIVADAEALRQQLLSELVVERTKVRTDLEEMSSARDRLVMALVVARSEIDGMSDRLDAISAKAGGDRSDQDVVVDDDAAASEVEELVAHLDGTSPSDGPPSAVGDTDGDAVIDLTDAAEGDDAVESPTGDTDGDDSTSDVEVADEAASDGPDSGGKSEAANRSAKKATRSRGKKSTRRRGSRARTRTSKTPAGSEAKSADSGPAAAIAVVDEPSDAETAPNAADVADTVVAEATTLDEFEELRLETELDSIDVSDADEHDGTDDGDMDAAIDDEEASLDHSLVEGFNTIELNEADLGLAGKGASADTGEGEAGMEQVITTVASREQSPHPDGNRGDLLIDEEFSGRLPAPISARDAALGRADEFHRSLRRALNDDQSDVLDRLRGGRGNIEVSELPRFADQMERYVEPLREGLAPVALAGAKVGGRREISAGVLDNLVVQLAKYIVDKVRIPVIREVEQVTDKDREKLFEPIRAAYRDFRNTSLLDLADDALYESFAIGLYGAIASGTSVVWLLDPRHDPDPVCEINAGRAAMAKGEPFPSGHVRPLALPNCRCLVVPDKT